MLQHLKPWALHVPLIHCGHADRQHWPPQAHHVCCMVLASLNEAPRESSLLLPGLATPVRGPRLCMTAKTSGRQSAMPPLPRTDRGDMLSVLLPVPVGDRRHCPRHTQPHRGCTLPKRQGPNAPIRNPSSTRTRSVPAQNRPRRPHADSHPKRRVHHPAVSRANALAADATRTRDPRGDRLSRGRGPGDHTALHHPWRSHRALESERPKKRHYLP